MFVYYRKEKSYGIIKKYISLRHYSIPLTDSLENNKLIIITPAGIITGSPISDDGTDNDANAFATLCSNFVKDYREENSLNPSEPLDGNDGFFILQDATLQTGRATYNFPCLNVFYDQIIAITIGNLK